MRSVISKSALAYALLLLCLGFSTQAYARPSDPPAFCALRAFDMMPLSKRPIYSVHDFGAKGDGKTDDTNALQRAFDQTPSGAVLHFPRGVYLHAKSLVLTKNGTILMGQGGILRATNPEDQALVLKGDRAAAIGLVLEGIGGQRSSQPQTVKIAVSGRWNQVLGNKITGGASAGIFVYGGKDFRVEGNDVRKTLADGIHMTAGARRGLVVNNDVFDVGDDKIAVVSYVHQINTPAEGMSGDILIKNNRVGVGPWGRGITVVGGENVALVDNTISDIPSVAGILISQEKPSGTGAVRHIVIKGNRIDRIELPHQDDPREYTGQGAIDLNSYNEYPMDAIDVIDNKITDTRFEAVRVLGTICHVTMMNNTMTHVNFQESGRDPIRVINNPCAPRDIICQSNSVDGKAETPDPKYCGKGSASVAFDYHAIETGIWTDCAP